MGTYILQRLWNVDSTLLYILCPLGKAFSLFLFIFWCLWSVWRICKCLWEIWYTSLCAIRNIERNLKQFSSRSNKVIRFLPPWFIVWLLQGGDMTSEKGNTSILTHLPYFGLDMGIMTSWPLEAAEVLTFSQNHYEFWNHRPKYVLKWLEPRPLEKRRSIHLHLLFRPNYSHYDVMTPLEAAKLLTFRQNHYDIRP